MNSIEAKLYALDADTVAFCQEFGDKGVVDLRIGLGNALVPQSVLTSAPTLAGTSLVVGGRIADNVQVDMPGGAMRGFELRWAFDPGNPHITLLPPPGQTHTRTMPNVWAAMSYDPAMRSSCRQIADTPSAVSAW
jgi:quinate dehydrogenase (quinone)